MPFVIALVVLILIALIVIVCNIKIVPQATVFVVERLGAYYATWGTGLHVKVPFIERIAKRVSLKEQVVDFRPQPVITRDNVTMQIDTVVFFQVTDAKLFTYGIERPMSAIENLTATTLRNIIGEMELDHTLTSRDIINSKITALLDEATDKWGIKVNRVELKNIIPPEEIQDAMEKQMKAERERRESILRAEGVKRSQILESEGQKESQILIAEAEKQAAILKAEAEKQAAIYKAEADKEAIVLKAEADKQGEILKADALREKKIREAEGEAQAIRLKQSAVADGIGMLNAASASDKVIALKSLEAFEKAANGRATKIIIPSELQSLAGLATSLKEITTDVKDDEQA
jgi:regulator of protease activity HflC (stomatin/prohibitin superfamily)